MFMSLVENIQIVYFFKKMNFAKWRIIDFLYYNWDPSLGEQ